ncbi:hypothetical protein TSUD_221050 [Trifolium subterraneum]|uniref:Reverse transcriptase domain-containing protein n=1 Tax=Trifolium subterraneum TaxID=3900 RepID=A0A2Z6MIC8_TRISU|nr:hypothetical protein TSUD_221050 [Trifolium subterraneum]
MSGKRKHWKKLLEFKLSHDQGEWCLGGDFNTILKGGKARELWYWWRESGGEGKICSIFDNMEVIDIPVTGKKYSWFSANGVAMSRLDQFLLSEGFMEKGGISTQWIGDCDISDDCPIWLICSNLNWGPKPFKLNNCWESLKVWNREVFGLIDLKIDKTVKEINKAEDLATNVTIEIIDGVVVLNEIVDLAKRRKDECLLFKVDFERAYDTVNWGFLERMMIKMGFLDAEGLAGMMRRAVDIGKFKGFKLNDNIQFQILQFADDTILMGKGISVGANPRRRETWKPVLEAMSNRLSTRLKRYPIDKNNNSMRLRMF